MLGELLTHPIRIRRRLVDLVDRDDDRHARRTRMLDRLEGLRHDAIVRCDHQHHHIGGAGAARAHRREGRVAWRVEESHTALRRLHMVGADVLGDAACLACGDLGLADVIEERGLAVIDMAHDRDHGRPRQFLDDRAIDALDIGLDLVVTEELGGVAHLLDHQHGGVLVDGLVDGGHQTQVHHDLDDFGGLDRHLLGEFLRGDRLADADLADDLRGRQLETVPLLHAHGRFALADALLLLAARRVATDVQFRTAVFRTTVAVGLSGRLDGLGLHRGTLRCRRRFGTTTGATGPIGVGLLSVTLLGLATGFLGGLAGGRLFLDAPAVLRLEALGLTTLVLVTLAFGLGGLFRLARLEVVLRRGGARLLFEHITLDVGAFDTHLDVDRARTASGAGELDLALLLALQGDLSRRGGLVDLLAALPVAATQMRQQLELRLVADPVVRTLDLDARLVELHQQLLDRHLEHLGELGNRYIGHGYLNRGPPRTSAHGPS